MLFFQHNLHREGKVHLSEHIQLLISYFTSTALKGLLIPNGVPDGLAGIMFRQPILIGHLFLRPQIPYYCST